LEPVETEGFWDEATAFFKGVVWIFMAQWPLKMPPGLIEMTAARTSPPKRPEGYTSIRNPKSKIQNISLRIAAVRAHIIAA
jgi:hypothetical protein